MTLSPPFAAWQTILPYLPLAVGAGVGLLAVTLVGLRGRGHRPARLADLAEPEPWAAAEVPYSDRRTSVRRDGPPIKVLLSGQGLPRGQGSGYVLDRSTGGLRIALGTAVAADTTLLVRAANAPDTVPWVTVLVRSCKDTGQHHELGCEFDQTPPWNVLLLFG